MLTETIVPGDLVVLVLVSGTRVAADGNFVSAIGLQIDKSYLTGKSFPQERSQGVEGYAGTLVVTGEGLWDVTQTDGGTKVGKISALSQEIRQS